VLLVLNGAPAVGKSTLAHRYADEHPLSLVIDIDMIRSQLGRWDEVGESKLVARDLAVVLARAHLLGGHDVIVPQYLGRPEFLERLRQVAAEVGVAFVEVVLTDDADEITKRFRARRAEYATTGAPHPEADLGDDAIATEVPEANERLLRDASARGVPVVSAKGGPEASYQSLRRVLASEH
jgi:predicted kinase